jgi:hypothetical protein
VASGVRHLNLATMDLLGVTITQIVG